MLKPIAILTLALSASAQVTVPSYARTKAPNGSIFSTWYNSSVFYSTTSTTIAHDSRSQLIYDTADVGVPATLWNSVAVRRATANLGGGYLGNNNSAFTANGTIVMSVSPLAYTSVTTAFASNHGSSPTTVFSGTLSLPARNSISTWPGPWEAPFPFTTPFVYVGSAGKTLVVDIMQTGNSGTGPWYVEVEPPDNGNRVENPPGPQSTCKFSNGNYNSGIGYRVPIVGGTWYVSYSGTLPANLIGIGALGANGAGSTWNGLLLPIDLGLFGAPGCKWGVSADVTVGLTSSTSSYTWPTLTIPNNPALGGQSFYDHAAFIDPLANAWGVVTSWSSKWTIGSTKGVPAATVFATGASASNPTGSVTQEAGVTLQFN